MNVNRKWGTIVSVAALVCGFGLGIAGVLPRLDIDVRWRVPLVDRGDPGPGARRDAGEELVLVVIGSSTCGWSNSDEFEVLVKAGRDAIRGLAAQRGVGFAAMGISTDSWVETGLRYLGRFGQFDEIAVGRSWRNTSILKYIYGDYPGQAATPQVVLLARTLVREGGQWRVDDERVLARRIGLSSIAEWVEHGANRRDLDPTPGS